MRDYDLRAAILIADRAQRWAEEGNFCFAGFQTQVNTVPGLGVEGDLLTSNPRFNALFGPGGAVAGALGLRMGAFCWAQANPLDPDNAPLILNNFGSGSVTGFVRRGMANGLITTFLADASMLLPPGFGAGEIFNGGDFLVKNNGTTFALPGYKAYANLGTGLVSFGTTGAPTVATDTGATFAEGTFSVTGSIAGNVMTVTFVGSGTIRTGATITGTGIPTVPAITVGAQLTGTAGGVGTYYVTGAGSELSVASTTISGTYGIVTISGAVTGATIVLGGLVAGASVPANAYITQLGTGAGAAGTYFTTPFATLSAQTMTVTVNVETQWSAASGGAAGELVKMTSFPPRGSF